AALLKQAPRPRSSVLYLSSRNSSLPHSWERSYPRLRASHCSRFASQQVVLEGSQARKPALPGSFHFHFRFDRHARTQWEVIIRRFGEDNLKRHALHDFDAIARRIFRGQETEGGPAARLNAVHFAREGFARIGVNFDFDGLPRTHPRQLRLFEIGGDIKLIRYDGQQRLAWVEQRAY